jgi:TolA-binding protein
VGPAGARDAADDCRSELVADERRGRLGDAGRLALDAHLATCASCRTAREVSADFDESDVVDVGDGARIRALSELARARGRRGGGNPVRARRLRAFAAAAALVVCGGSASAGVWFWRRPAPAPTAPAAAAPAVEHARRAPRGPASDPAPAVVADAPVAPVAAADPAPRPRARAAARAAAAAPGADALSPSALLQQATEARQAGAGDRAAALYRRLQREFPASSEAVLSAVPLGRVLLAGGYPRAALAQFDAYLARAHGGPLIPEALYGRARALALLGDRPEERRTWSRLVADFPDSAYAPLGRRRLAERE